MQLTKPEQTGLLTGAVSFLGSAAVNAYALGDGSLPSLAGALALGAVAGITAYAASAGISLGTPAPAA